MKQRDLLNQAIAAEKIKNDDDYKAELTHIAKLLGLKSRLDLNPILDWYEVELNSTKLLEDWKIDKMFNPQNYL